jgi:phosphohistidine phosphatase
MARIYLVRHGHAEEGFGKDDADRALTAYGVERLERAAPLLPRMDVAPAHIFSSPRLRARQTANILAGALGLPVEISEAVNFGFDTVALSTFLTDYPDTDLMFVGHNPDMSLMLFKLCGAEVSMKKGAVARVDMTSPRMVRGQLVWLVTPKVFDALAD